MLRKDFQDLAEERIQNAELLLSAERFSAAYYLTGLAVECALKACIAKRTLQHEFPDRQRTLGAYQHNLDSLLEIADLKVALTQASANPAFAANWQTTRVWQIDSRYTLAIDSLVANALFNSVNDRADGVLSWLRTLW